MPTTRSAGRRTGDGSAGPPFSWVTLASWVRITEPTRTPLSWASVKDASTSWGSDGSGIRPESSITIRGSCPGGTSLIRVFSVSIGFRQDAQPNVTAKAAGTGVTATTCGSRASCGSGVPL
jgi:hypothetical protein